MTVQERAALVAEIGAMLEIRADGQYGLHDVTQRQQALQTAWAAEHGGGDDALVAAALMHDLGHLVHDLGENPAGHDVDDKHEGRGHAWLAAAFGPAVTEPVRLHVAAKRFLCATEPDYFAKLAPDSVLEPVAGGRPDIPRTGRGLPRLAASRRGGATATL